MNERQSQERFEDAVIREAIDELRQAKPHSVAPEELARVRDRLLRAAERIEAEQQRLDSARDVLGRQLLQLRDELARESALLRKVRELRKQLLAEPIDEAAGAPADSRPAGAADFAGAGGAGSVENVVPLAAPRAALERLPTVQAVLRSANEEVTRAPRMAPGRARQPSRGPRPTQAARGAAVATLRGGRHGFGASAELASAERIDSAAPSTNARRNSLRPERPSIPFVKPAPRSLQDPGEAGISIRTWTPLPVVGLVLLIALGAIVVGVDRVRSEASLLALARALEDPNSDPSVIETLLAKRYDSPLDRWNGRRDYLVGQGAARTRAVHPAEKTANVAYWNVARAVQRAPANVWYRITQAQLADPATVDREERERLRAAVERLSTPDPYALAALGEIRLREGLREGALESFSRALVIAPDETGACLEHLAASKVPMREALAIVPAEPRAALAAAKFLKIRSISPNEFLEGMLTRISQDATKRDPEALEAYEELLEWTGEAGRRSRPDAHAPLAN